MIRALKEWLSNGKLWIWCHMPLLLLRELFKPVYKQGPFSTISYKKKSIKKNSDSAMVLRISGFKTWFN